MKASIDRDGCISCGVCAATCPEVFQMADDGLAEVHAEIVPNGFEANTLKARDDCPVSVISVD